MSEFIQTSVTHTYIFHIQLTVLCAHTLTQMRYPHSSHTDNSISPQNYGTSYLLCAKRFLFSNESKKKNRHKHSRRFKKAFSRLNRAPIKIFIKEMHSESNYKRNRQSGIICPIRSEKVITINTHTKKRKKKQLKNQTVEQSRYLKSDLKIQPLQIFTILNFFSLTFFCRKLIFFSLLMNANLNADPRR